MTPPMSAFTTYIAGFHRRSANNTSLDVPSSIASPNPSVSTHIRLLRAPPPTSRSPDFGNMVSLPTPNIGIPHMDDGNSSRQHISAPTVSHISQPSISSPISQSSNHHTSSQVPNSSVHRSLRRIINQDQDISTSPRRLRSSNSHSSSQM